MCSVITKITFLNNNVSVQPENNCIMPRSLHSYQKMDMTKKKLVKCIFIVYFHIQLTLICTLSCSSNFNTLHILNSVLTFICGITDISCNCCQISDNCWMSKWTDRVLICIPIKTSGKRGPEDL
jgi:hypothetical protein